MSSLDSRPKTVEMVDIVKKFGDFTANAGIGLTLHQGEVHALLGENGAGKTTLMKILYGLYRPTSGIIRINGRAVTITDPNVAISHGIGMVHQHFMLVSTFTVTENIILGNETTKPLGVLDLKRAQREVAQLSRCYGLIVDPQARIEDLSVGSQQRVEILKALYRGAEILILDEPTAVLTPREIQELAGILRNLTREGKSIIIITHKLHEIKQMADTCTIIRRGEHIDSVDVAQVSERELAAMMVGREVSFSVAKKPARPGATVLELNDLAVADHRGVRAVDGLSLALRQGEILGVAGVDGNGQSELVEALTGLRPVTSGTIQVKGRTVTRPTPHGMINDHNIRTIHEDRRKRGLVMAFDIAENLILETYFKAPFSRRGTLQEAAIYTSAGKICRDFDIRPPDPRLAAWSLSGGNQQKVVIAREVSHNPRVLIASQPTRGLDVGAIEYVHRALVAQRDQGRAVLLISFELDEVINLSDRIAVIFEGRIVGTLNAGDADEKEIGLLMAGGRRGGASP